MCSGAAVCSVNRVAVKHQPVNTAIRSAKGNLLAYRLYANMPFKTKRVCSTCSSGQSCFSWCVVYTGWSPVCCSVRQSASEMSSPSTGAGSSLEVASQNVYRRSDSSLLMKLKISGTPLKYPQQTSVKSTTLLNTII